MLQQLSQVAAFVWASGKPGAQLFGNSYQLQTGINTSYTILQFPQSSTHLLQIMLRKTHNVQADLRLA